MASQLSFGFWHLADGGHSGGAVPGKDNISLE